MRLCFRIFKRFSHDAAHFKLQPIQNSTVNDCRRMVEERYGIKAHKQSITMPILPLNKIKIEVGFQPKDDSLKTSLIIIR